MTFQCKHQPCHNKKNHGFGYCATHYRQKYVLGQETKDVQKPVHKTGDKCSYDGCDRTAKAKGLCNTHWAQVYKYGMEARPINQFIDMTCAAPWCKKEYRTNSEHQLCKECRNRCGKYNVSEEWYIAMSQSCEICGSNRRISIDHDHNTEIVRGVLCSKCNSTLGYAGDNLEGIMRFVKYLEKQDV